MKLLFVLLAIALGLPSYGLAAFFIDTDKAFKRAKKENKPLLISFYGIWCPPCNELEETVFESSGFLAKSKAFVLLKVDADAPSSWKLKSRYKVGGYPTVVFTNSQGQEVYRVVGYRAPGDFLKVLDLVLEAKGKDVRQACQSSATDDLWRCAVICTERKEKACAESAFQKLSKKLPPESPRAQLAEGYFVQNAPNADLKRDGYERLLRKYSNSPMALVWALEYLALFEDSGVPKNLRKLDLVEAVATPSITSPAPTLGEWGLSYTDLLQMRAELLDHLGKTAEAKAAWKEASAVFEKEALALGKGKPARGFTLERISCLEQAGEIEAALKLAEEYRGLFPQEFTFHFVSASIGYRAKRYAQALPVAQKAFEHSYGDNRIRAAILLIQLYATVPNKEAARKVWEEVTRSIKPDTSLEVRTHRYLKKLNDTWAEHFS